MCADRCEDDDGVILCCQHTVVVTLDTHCWWEETEENRRRAGLLPVPSSSSSNLAAIMRSRLRLRVWIVAVSSRACADGGPRLSGIETGDGRPMDMVALLVVVDVEADWMLLDKT